MKKGNGSITTTWKSLAVPYNLWFNKAVLMAAFSSTLTKTWSNMITEEKKYICNIGRRKFRFFINLCHKNGVECIHWLRVTQFHFWISGCLIGINYLAKKSFFGSSNLNGSKNVPAMLLELFQRYVLSFFLRVLSPRDELWQKIKHFSIVRNGKNESRAAEVKKTYQAVMKFLKWNCTFWEGNKRK